MPLGLRPLLILILCLAWLLPGLVGHDPWKPDEAYTFGVVYEILQGGSWIIPQIAGEAFVDKPPLFHLTAAFSVSPVDTVAQARVWSASPSRTSYDILPQSWPQ